LLLLGTGEEMGVEFISAL